MATTPPLSTDGAASLVLAPLVLLDQPYFVVPSDAAADDSTDHDGSVFKPTTYAADRAAWERELPALRVAWLGLVQQWVMTGGQLPVEKSLALSRRGCIVPGRLRGAIWVRALGNPLGVTSQEYNSWIALAGKVLPAQRRGASSLASSGSSSSGSTRNGDVHTRALVTAPSIARHSSAAPAPDSDESDQETSVVSKFRAAAIHEVIIAASGGGGASSSSGDASSAQFHPRGLALQHLLRRRTRAEQADGSDDSTDETDSEGEGAPDTAGATAGGALMLTSASHSLPPPQPQPHSGGSAVSPSLSRAAASSLSARSRGASHGSTATLSLSLSSSSQQHNRRSFRRAPTGVMLSADDTLDVTLPNSSSSGLHINGGDGSNIVNGSSSSGSSSAGNSPPKGAAESRAGSSMRDDSISSSGLAASNTHSDSNGSSSIVSGGGAPSTNFNFSGGAPSTSSSARRAGGFNFSPESDSRRDRAIAAFTVPTRLISVPEAESSGVPGHARQISATIAAAAAVELDLSRTFPELGAFFAEGSPSRYVMQRVLTAYALAYPAHGYVQGMTHLAAMLIVIVGAAAVVTEDVHTSAAGATVRTVGGGGPRNHHVSVRVTGGSRRVTAAAAAAASANSGSSGSGSSRALLAEQVEVVAVTSTAHALSAALGDDSEGSADEEEEEGGFASKTTSSATSSLWAPSVEPAPLPGPLLPFVALAIPRPPPAPPLQQRAGARGGGFSGSGGSPSDGRGTNFNFNSSSSVSSGGGLTSPSGKQRGGIAGYTASNNSAGVLSSPGSTRYGGSGASYSSSSGVGAGTPNKNSSSSGFSSLRPDAVLPAPLLSDLDAVAGPIVSNDTPNGPSVSPTTGTAASTLPSALLATSSSSSASSVQPPVTSTSSTVGQPHATSTSGAPPPRPVDSQYLPPSSASKKELFAPLQQQQQQQQHPNRWKKSRWAVLDADGSGVPTTPPSTAALHEGANHGDAASGNFNFGSGRAAGRATSNFNFLTDDATREESSDADDYAAAAADVDGAGAVLRETPPSAASPEEVLDIGAPASSSVSAAAASAAAATTSPSAPASSRGIMGFFFGSRTASPSTAATSSDSGKSKTTAPQQPSNATTPAAGRKTPVSFASLLSPSTAADAMTALRRIPVPPPISPLAPSTTSLPSSRESVGLGAAVLAAEGVSTASITGATAVAVVAEQQQQPPPVVVYYPSTSTSVLAVRSRESVTGDAHASSPSTALKLKMQASPSSPTSPSPSLASAVSAVEAALCERLVPRVSAEVLIFSAFAALVRRPPLCWLVDRDALTLEAWYSIYTSALSRNAPHLSSHLISLGITPGLYLVGWLLTQFSKPCGLETASRLWDRILIGGHREVLRCAVGLMLLLGPRIRSCSSLEDARKILVHVPGDLRSEFALCACIDAVKLRPGDEDLLLALEEAAAAAPPPPRDTSIT